MDQAFIPLLNQLASKPGQEVSPALWFADESHDEIIAHLAKHRDVITVISNRFNISQLARQHGIKAVFSDWEIPAELPFGRVFLRIGKEKAVNHRLLKLAYSGLPEGGELNLSGYKDEGIKSCFQKAKALFESPELLVKDGPVYFSRIIKLRPTQLTDFLDDQNYHTLRPIPTPLEFTVLSKPGVYGWDKVDRGSVLLVETFRKVFESPQKSGAREGYPGSSLLDLGCGYGYLTLATSTLPFVRRVATDNNAGALDCMRANATAFGIAVEVVAADCGDMVDGRFDVILCNPPFHKGFDVDSDLHRKFLEGAARRLAAHGSAYFVVNSFLPLEKEARRLFKSVDCLANDGHFKIIQLTKGSGQELRDSRERA